MSARAAAHRRLIVLAAFCGLLAPLPARGEDAPAAAAAPGVLKIGYVNLEEVMRQRVYAHIDTIEQASNKVARVANRSTPMMETLGGFAVAAALLIRGLGLN